MNISSRCVTRSAIVCQTAKKRKIPRKMVYYAHLNVNSISLHFTEHSIVISLLFHKAWFMIESEPPVEMWKSKNLKQQKQWKKCHLIWSIIHSNNICRSIAKSFASKVSTKPSAIQAVRAQQRFITILLGKNCKIKSIVICARLYLSLCCVALRHEWCVFARAQ